jgi:hypothetical protein
MAFEKDSEDNRDSRDKSGKGNKGKFGTSATSAGGSGSFFLGTCTRVEEVGSGCGLNDGVGVEGVGAKASLRIWLLDTISNALVDVDLVLSTEEQNQREWV